MTKRVNWLPNLRVDVPDITAGTNTLSSGLLQQNYKQFILDHFARISAGFRVAIADQILSPGQFTVYNGIGFDRSGQIMQNEDEENASRSLTILADGQYFIEVLFVTEQTNTDARGFWDPTVDNGTDPSGDVRLPGREFSQNTATRLTPDWQIVSPISTTGFEINTLPNSLKVPVACINVVAGVISGAVPVNARTVLSASVPAFVSLITVLDSRIFPDTFNATVDAEAVVVLANDRVNGKLTLAANLALPHAVGARVAITGVGLQEFLPERTTPPLPTSGSADARPHYWQADEERGFALSQNPYAGTGRADVSIQSLKDQVDFLSAQVREMRFGAEKNVDIGKLAPPATFPLSPRYFDKSGGLQGARTAIYTVGDGVTSWGDFNVAQMGSFAAALQAAINALPVGGGGIHIKNTPTVYSISGTTVLINPPFNGNVWLSGDGRESTVIEVDGAVHAFATVGSFLMGMRDLTIERAVTCTAPYVFKVTGASARVTMRVNDCLISGIGTDLADNTSISGKFTNMICVAGVGSNGIGLQGDFNNAIFENCVFGSDLTGVGARAIQSFGGSQGTNNVEWHNCFIPTPGFTATAGMEFQQNVFSPQSIIIDHCEFGNGAPLGSQILFDNTALLTKSNIDIRDCVNSGPATFVYADNVTNFHIERCNVTINYANTPGIWIGASTSNDKISITDCVITQTNSANNDGDGIRIEYCLNSLIRGCVAYNCDQLIKIGTCFNTTIEGCKHYNPTANRGKIGIYLTNFAQDLSISACQFFQLRHPTQAVIGMYFSTGQYTNISIIGCNFKTLNTSVGTGRASAILIQPSSVTTCHDITIADCNIEGLTCSAANSTRAIEIADVVARLTIANCNMNTLGANSGETIGIHLHGGTNVNVTGNNITTLGNAGTVNHAIKVEASPGAGPHANNVVIRGNTIAAVSGALTSLQGDIQFYNAGSRVVVADNVVAMSNVNKTGISFYHDVANPNEMHDFVVSNNVIGALAIGSCRSGVDFVLSSGNDERVTISNNIIRGFVITGIEVFNSTNIRNIIIQGNSMISGESTPFGISCSRINEFNISNNVIEETNGVASARFGIALASSANGVISSNYTRLAKGTAAASHIDLDTVVAVHCVGNHILNSDLTFAGRGIYTHGISARTYAIGNVGQNFDGGTGICFVGLTVTKGQSDAVQPNVGTAPAGSGDVGLNYTQG